MRVRELGRHFRVRWKRLQIRYARRRLGWTRVKPNPTVAESVMSQYQALF
jgi:hypothetical protein